jgi:hypothetical protein
VTDDLNRLSSPVRFRGDDGRECGMGACQVVAAPILADRHAIGKLRDRPIELPHRPIVGNVALQDVLSKKV